MGVGRAAPSKRDMIEYLGGTATGQTLQTVAYLLTVLSNETHALVSCEVDDEMSKVGWLGFGVGSTMSDADIVILWPNSDSSWTLSHRRATTTALPLLLGDTVTPPHTDSTSLLAVVPALSSSSSDKSPTTVVTFSRPLEPDADGYTTAENYVLKREKNQGVIFAKGDANPRSDAQDAGLEQHALDAMGGTYVDLSVEFTAESEGIDAPLVPVTGESSTLPTGRPSSSSGSNATAASSSTGTGDTDVTASTSATGTRDVGGAGTGKSTATAAGPSSTSSGSDSKAGELPYSTVIKIHAICAASAWLFVAPLGVLYARLARGPPGSTLFKFPWHFFQQTWIATPLTFGAVALAHYAARLKTTSSSASSGHKVLGYTFAALLAVQVVLGWWTHLSHGKSGQPRALKAWFHIVIGVSLIGLGFVQVRLGMSKYGLTDSSYATGYWV
ncbi:hypothetical protein JCM11491_005441 [Sporobolomyces phaffii]